MQPDLSLNHQPIGCSPPAALSEAVLEHHEFTEDQIEFFSRHGYLAGIPMLDQDQLSVLRQELEEISQPDHPGRSFWYEFNPTESGRGGGMRARFSDVPWQVGPAGGAGTHGTKLM